MPTVDILNTENKKVGALALNDAFTGTVKENLFYETVKMQLANRRRGTASTKTRAYVSGGGKKPWKQKGTGRGRAGSIRSPLWRHGGVVFGPHPRSYRYGLSSKTLNGALLSALNDRALKDSILILDKLEMSAPKAKEMRAVLDNLKLKGKVLLVSNQYEKNVALACRNIQGLSL